MIEPVNLKKIVESDDQIVAIIRGRVAIENGGWDYLDEHGVPVGREQVYPREEGSTNKPMGPIYLTKVIPVVIEGIEDKTHEYTEEWITRINDGRIECINYVRLPHEIPVVAIPGMLFEGELEFLTSMTGSAHWKEKRANREDVIATLHNLKLIYEKPE